MSGTKGKSDMKIRRIEAGRYQVGEAFVVRRPPIPGRQQTTTWRNALTGEWLGYTLKEAVEQLMRKQARGI